VIAMPSASNTTERHVGFMRVNYEAVIRLNRVPLGTGERNVLSEE
jgi:hypothetical protein